MRPTSAIRWVGRYLVASLVAVVWWVLFGGIWPRTVVGWFLLAMLGLPIYLLCAWVGDRLCLEKRSKRIDPSPGLVSGRRVAYLLLVMLLAIGVTLGVWWLIGPWGSWLEQQLDVWHL